MIKISKITIIWFIVIITLCFACSKKSTKPEPPKYKWTILGYFDGNNSPDQALDGHSYVIKDVQELEGIDSAQQQVQILVMLGSFKTGGYCRYYHIQRHLNEPPDSISSEVLVPDPGKKDMSDPTTLRNFISFGVQKYPAEHYLLIINDHGRGWKGVCSDTINGGRDWMTLPDLSFALSGFAFDILWFYTPSMATMEMAYQMKDRAKYMIASQFKWHQDNILGATHPVNSAWLPYLTNSPDIGAWEFGRKITEAIYQAAHDISEYKHVHSVLIDLTKIPKLATDVSNLGRSLIDSTGPYWNEVWDAWKLSHFLGYDDSDSNFVDLCVFAQQIQGKTNLNPAIIDPAKSVESSVNDAVIVQYAIPDYPLAHIPNGISIHLPWNQDDFDSTNYTQLDFSQTNWDHFISVFIQNYLGNYAGTLNITSSPTGAKIFLNGLDTKDTTNAVIGGLLPGTYLVHLVKPACKDTTKSTSVYARQTTFVYAGLKCSY